MVRQSAWVLALVLACVAPAAATLSEDGPQGRSEKAQGGPGGGDKSSQPPNRPPDDRWKWWLYDKAELGVTDQQSAEINQIFESTIPKLRETRQEMDRADEELSRTIKEHKADLATISILIDRAESTRSQYAKLRVLMLYRMHQLLSADQRARLGALRARQDAARKEKQPPDARRRKP